MELLEFKNKMLKLCGVNEIKDIGGVIFNVVLEHNEKFYKEYLELTDDSKDWLQALYQYYEADRKHKKQDYTPKSICKLVSALAQDCKNVYDCCGGSGALTNQMLKDFNIENIYIEELDEMVIPFLLFNLCLNNANGIVKNSDVLENKVYSIYELKKGEKYSYCAELVENTKAGAFDVSISNPPFNIKWNAPAPLDMDKRFPVIPPANNANYAFVLHCLSFTKQKAILILPNGVMSQSNELHVRQYLIENDLIETVIILPDNMFESTSISTCILVLNKNKKHKGTVTFIDSRRNCVTKSREQNGQFGGASHTNRTYIKSYNILSDGNISKILSTIDKQENIAEFSAIKTNNEIADNEYLLVPSRYIAFDEQEQKHRDFQEIADNFNYIASMQNSCKLVINETIAKQLGMDIEAFKASKENSKLFQEQMRTLGIDVVIEDYVSFTKNKNEFIFKCNDKEIMPNILIQFLSIWKNQIALLNTMQNDYLAELRDALLPDLMSGAINISES